MKNVFSKGIIGSLMAAAVLVTATASAALAPQDGFVVTIYEKSVIHGQLAQNPAGNLVYDPAGNARFLYHGELYTVVTDPATGELTDMGTHLGAVDGEAAFPKDFVALSAGVNALMGAMMNGTWDGTMPMMPSIVPWTCNHCVISDAAGNPVMISIVDALDPNSPFYSAEMAAKLDAGLIDGSAGAMDNMRMKGRAFTGLTPASFDPAAKTMSVRMAGCSAVVAIAGPNAGKVGTLCMNSTAEFNVSGAIPRFNPLGQLVGYEPSSQISADGSSNCVTVLHAPTM